MHKTSFSCLFHVSVALKQMANETAMNSHNRENGEEEEIKKNDAINATNIIQSTFQPNERRTSSIALLYFISVKIHTICKWRRRGRQAAARSAKEERRETHFIGASSLFAYTHALGMNLKLFRFSFLLAVCYNFAMDFFASTVANVSENIMCN